MTPLPHSAAGTAVITRTTRRWLVRRDAPVWPFVWRGLLPLLALLALAAFAFRAFAPDTIEASVERETRAQLDARGMRWAGLSVSGQDVVLSGTPPAPGDGDQALTLARATTCPSWAGRLSCAVKVSGNFTEVAVKPAAAAAAAVPPTPQAVAACENRLADAVKASKIEFATGSAVIQRASGAVLDTLAVAARGCPGVVRVEGHTDSVGLSENNQALSQARAASVRAALVERGVAEARLAAQGFGADKPLADNATPDGRARNRRIEFRVVSAKN